MSGEKKKKKSGEDPVQRTDYVRVSDILRQAREEKGLSIEEAAHGINLRVSQVRAIEEGNYDILPGTAYATGFIRSYAGYLKLDAADIVTRFKAENAGMAASRPELNFPEPLVEGNAPDPLMIGMGVGVVAVLLLGWIFFSGGDDMEASIPAPPVETASTPSIFAPAEPATVPVETTSAEQAIVPSTVTTVLSETPVQPATEVVTAAVATPTDNAAPVAATETVPAATEVKTETAAPAEPEKPIVVEPPKSRVVLKSSQSVWVQVSTGNKIIAKKVMRPGETLSLPDVPGLTLTTSNAGGLKIMIDGKTMPQLGGAGAIVRGVPLDAKSMEKYRYRVRDY